MRFEDITEASIVDSMPEPLRCWMRGWLDTRQGEGSHSVAVAVGPKHVYVFEFRSAEGTIIDKVAGEPLCVTRRDVAAAAIEHRRRHIRLGLRKADGEREGLTVLLKGERKRRGRVVAAIEGTAAGIGEELMTSAAADPAAVARLERKGDASTGGGQVAYGAFRVAVGLVGVLLLVDGLAGEGGPIVILTESSSSSAL